MTRMEPFRERPAGKLSGGMKQKLALMCTLLHQPRDPAFSTSRPTASTRSRAAISGPSSTSCVKDGITVFITTAYLDEAERCNRVGLMHKGR